MRGWFRVVLLLSGAALAAAAETPLSPAQRAVIAERMARLSPTRKQAAAEWPDAKKVAEFICAKPGSGVVMEEVKAADRVVLAPGRAGIQSLTLDGNTKLTGNGIVRVGPFWTPFTFECVLNPDKGTVRTFTFHRPSTPNGAATPGGETP